MAKKPKGDIFDQIIRVRERETKRAAKPRKKKPAGGGS
jgi:hypothetical protein